MRRRHLAPAKALDLDLAPEFLDPLVAALRQITRRQNDLDLALQPVSTRFRYLHRTQINALPRPFSIV
jgi:hypothetical protein